MISEMLTRRECDVMRAVFTLSGGKERFLCTPQEISALIRHPMEGEALERTLRALELDGYFDLLLSSRKGERIFVVHMRTLGLSFRRDDVRRKRAVLFKWGIAAVGAALSFLVGILLRLLFGG